MLFRSAAAERWDELRSAYNADADYRTVSRFNAEGYRRLVRIVAPAASTDPSRPVLTGIHFHVTDDGAEVAATDSYRLHVASSPDAARLEHGQPFGDRATIPAAACVIAADLSGKIRADGVELRTDGRHAELSGPRWGVVARIITGQYPDYDNLRPSDARLLASLSAADYAQHAPPPAKGAPQRFTVKPGSVEIEQLAAMRDAAVTGAGSVAADTEPDAHDFTIGVNGAFARDAVMAAAADYDAVNVYGITELRPLMYCTGAHDSPCQVWCVIMPLRLP